MKEFLSIREIDYQSINVLADAVCMAELRQLGARSVPVLADGKRWVSALSIAAVVDFLKLDPAEAAGPALSPDALVARLVDVLRRAATYARQFSDDELGLKLSGRDRSYREIAHHVFNIPVAFLTAVERYETYTYESTVAPPPDDLKTGDDIARFGETVIARIEHWWRTEDDPALVVTIDTYYGQQTTHELLERTTWHSTQHVRQLMSLLESLGIDPKDPLTPAHLDGLPLPEKVWD